MSETPSSGQMKQQLARDLCVSPSTLANPKLRVGDVLADSMKRWSWLKMYRRATSTSTPMESFVKLPISALFDAMQQPPPAPSIPTTSDEHCAQRLLRPMQSVYAHGRSTVDIGPCSIYSVVDFSALDVLKLERALNYVFKHSPMLMARVVNGSRQEIGPFVPIKIPVTHVNNDAGELDARRRKLEVFFACADEYFHCEVTKFVADTASSSSSAPSTTYRLHLLVDMQFMDLHSWLMVGKLVAAEYMAEGSGVGNGDVVKYLWENPPKVPPFTPEDDRALMALPPGPILPTSKQTAHPDGDGCCYRPARRHSVAVDNWGDLLACAATEQVTPTVYISVAVAKAVSRYARHPTFSIPFTVSHRTDAEADTMGEYTDVVLCSFSVENNSSPVSMRRELQKQLSRAQDACRREGGVSGIDIMARYKELHGNFDPLQWPIVISSFLGMPLLSEVLSTLQQFGGSVVHQQSRTPSVPVDIQLYETDGKLGVHFDYDPTVVSSEVVTGIANSLLENLATPCKKPSWMLPTLPPPTNNALVWGFERISRKYHHLSRLLHGGLVEAYLTDPLRAVVDDHDGRVFTVKELFQSAASLADQLHKLFPHTARSLRPIIAVSTSRGFLQCVSVLGVLLYGASYLPVNPADGGSRQMIETARCKCVVGPRVGSCSLTHIAAELAPSTPESIDAHLISKLWDPEDLAYLIPTSGSTGHPKGVMISHRSATNTVVDINQRCGVSAETRLLSTTALTFDLSVFDVFGVGAKGCIVTCEDLQCEDDLRHIANQWADRSVKCRCNMFNGVPGTLSLLGASVSLAAFTHVLVSGDKFYSKDARLLKAKYPATKFMVMGGATEGSIWSIFHDVVGDETTTLVPYGRALTNQTMTVVDCNLEPRPPNVCGQIVIGGVGVAMGYLCTTSDQQRKEEVKFETPQNCNRMGRLYKTGDNGLLLENGEIEILGREDRQVKVAGFRVELVEVERALQDSCREADITVVYKHGTLTAFVAGCSPCVFQALQEDVRKTLPHYKYPSEWKLLENLPLTANGKVDVKALEKQAAGDDAKVTCDDEGGHSLLLPKVRECVEKVLEGRLDGRLAPRHDHTRIRELGLGSPDIGHLSTLVAEQFGLHPSSIGRFFGLEHYTIMKMAIAIHSFQTKTSTSAFPAASPLPSCERPVVHIVGMDCRYPGSSNSIEKLRRFQRSGRDAVEEITPDRYCADPVKINDFLVTPKMAMIDNPWQFNEKFYDIPESEASSMDPQQRVSIEVAYGALYDAGYTMKSLKGKRIAVVAAGLCDEFSQEQQHPLPQGGAPVIPAMQALYISHAFDLKGPSLYTDAACASGLAAVIRGEHLIRMRKVDTVVVVVAHLSYNNSWSKTMAAHGILSPNMRSATFTTEADGLGRGEGVGAIVLQRAGSPDLQPNTKPYATILGSAEQNCGRVASVTTPSSTTQSEVMAAAQRDANVTPDDISLVECHGSGTRLGDDIEISGLERCFNTGTRTSKLLLTTAKPTFGHLEGGAGLLGLISVVCNAHNPPPIHHFNMNIQRVDLGEWGKVVDTNDTIVPNSVDCNGAVCGGPIVGVSSYGFGGANVHIVSQIEPGERAPRRRIVGEFPETCTFAIKAPVDHYIVQRQAIENAHRIPTPEAELLVNDAVLASDWLKAPPTAASADTSRHIDVVVLDCSDEQKAALTVMKITRQAVGRRLMYAVVNPPPPVWGALLGTIRTARIEGYSTRAVHITLPTASVAATASPAQMLDDSTRVARCVVDTVAGEDEDVIVSFDGTFVTLRLELCSKLSGKSYDILPDRAYIVSGGGGALGRLVIDLLVRQGATRIVSLGRGAAPTPSAAVVHEQCDVSDRASVEKLRDKYPDVAAVFHCAGALGDAMLANQNEDTVRKSFGAKVDGARHLHDAFRPDLFVAFSSAAFVFGSSGQSSYAAANGALSELVNSWCELGESAMSIEWGAWRAGMAATAYKTAEKQGFGSISDTYGIRILRNLLAAGFKGCVCVSPIEWDKFRAHHKIPSFLGNFGGAVASGTPDPKKESQKEAVTMAKLNELFADAQVSSFEELAQEEPLSTQIDSSAVPHIRKTLVSWDLMRADEQLGDLRPATIIARFRQHAATAQDDRPSPLGERREDHLLVVGAGVGGLVCCDVLTEQNIKFTCVEKAPQPGGVWKQWGNADSKLQIDSSGYALSKRAPFTTGFPSQEHVLSHADSCATRHNVRVSTTVTKVEKVGTEGFRVHLQSESGIAELQTFSGVLFMTGSMHQRREPFLSLPPPHTTPSAFHGPIVTGTANDMEGIDFTGKTVAIVGHGAFAVENMRTVLQKSASKVHMVCKQRHVVFPRVINYWMNCSEKPIPVADVYDTVKSFYEFANATIPPSLTRDGFTQDSVPAGSDVYFLALRSGRLVVHEGPNIGVCASGLTLGDGDSGSAVTIGADIIITCCGFTQDQNIVPGGVVALENRAGDAFELFCGSNSPWPGNDPNLLSFNDSMRCSASVPAQILGSLLTPSYPVFVRSLTRAYLHYRNHPVEFSNDVKSLSSTDASFSAKLSGLLSKFLQVEKKSVSTMTKIRYDREKFNADSSREWDSLQVGVHSSDFVSSEHLHSLNKRALVQIDPGSRRPMKGVIVPPKRLPRALFLHGQGTTASLTNRALDMRGWFPHMDVVIPPGPFEMEPFTDDNKIDLLGLRDFQEMGLYGAQDVMNEFAGEFDTFQGVDIDPTTNQAEMAAHRVEATLDVIREVVKSHGPFDILIGFCQGATTALMALNEEHNGNRLGLDTVTRFIGIAPWICPIYDARCNTPRGHLQTPAFLAVGNNDHDIFQKAVPEVASMFERCESHTFNGKHVIPSLSTDKAFVSALRRFLE